MAITLTSIKNEFGHAAQDIVKVGKAIKSAVIRAASEAPVVAAEIQKSSVIVEGLTAIAAPEFVAIEQIAYSGLGVLAKAIEDAGPAASANGTSISLDQALWNDIKAIIPSFKKYMASSGSSAPVTSAAPSPTSSAKS